MFNFKLKENNVSFLNLKVNNIHSYVLKALEATIYKKMQAHEKYKSMVYIGGEKISLKRFLQTPLRELPQSFRQFVGHYVYIKAKMRFNEINLSTVKMTYKILMRMRAIEEYSSKVEKLSILTKTKIRFIDNIFVSKIKLKDLIKSKAKFNIYHSLISGDIIHKLILKTKSKVLYSSKVVMKDIAKIKTKLKLLNTVKSGGVLKFLVIAKAKGSSIHNSKVYSKFKIRAKTVTEDIVSISKASIGSIPLILYKYEELANLPKKLRDFSGSTVRLLGKMRLSENNISNMQVGASRFLLKTKLLNQEKNDCVIESTNAYECKRLNIYTSTQLKDLPSSLFDFCYTNPLEAWSGVNKTYSSWEEISKLESWGKLIQQ